LLPGPTALQANRVQIVKTRSRNARFFDGHGHQRMAPAAQAYGAARSSGEDALASGRRARVHRVTTRSIPADVLREVFRFAGGITVRGKGRRANSRRFRSRLSHRPRILNENSPGRAAGVAPSARGGRMTRDELRLRNAVSGCGSMVPDGEECYNRHLSSLGCLRHDVLRASGRCRRHLDLLSIPEEVQSMQKRAR
jgi:hypothetical protein